jgi:hypothetical protein
MQCCNFIALQLRCVFPSFPCHPVNALATEHRVLC